jgi:hypothetical protein
MTAVAERLLVRRSQGRKVRSALYPRSRARLIIAKWAVRVGTPVPDGSIESIYATPCTSIIYHHLARYLPPIFHHHSTKGIDRLSAPLFFLLQLCPYDPAARPAGCVLAATMHVLTAFTRFLALAAPVLSFTTLSDDTLAGLPSLNDDFNIKNGKLLAPILRVRVPGQPSIEPVRQFFLDFFKKELPAWKITLQNSTQPTVLDKPITFVNIIATRDPPWAQPGDVGRLALVAHYDSKMTPEGFIGATDSAAPCAMLLHAARSVDEALTKKWDAMEKSGDVGLSAEKGVQLLLLDGEESFISWTNEDSLYGAR